MSRFTFMICLYEKKNVKTLLKIDSSLRLQNSYSREMGNYFAQEWKKQRPNGNIIGRDVAQNPVAHLNQETLDGFYGKTNTTGLLKLSDILIEELHQCDELLVTSPMYNFGIPSSLKAYFDLTVRTQKTFRYDGKQEGLLTNKKAYLISAMGDRKEKSENLSLTETHVQKVLNYMGIKEIHCFLIDGTSEQEYANKIMAKQKSTIAKLLNTMNYGTN